MDDNTTNFLMADNPNLFGCGSVAQVTTTNNQSGQYLSINLGFALGVTFGVYASRGVSGAESTGAESTGAESTGSESTGAESTGAESTGAESTGAESTGAESTGAESTGAESTGAESTGAESTGAESTGAESTGAESTGAESTGAESTGAESTGAESTGAHLNPAVSLSLCALGRHSWTKLPFYVFFQCFGAFLGAATVALQYYEAIRWYSGGELIVSGATATAGIFCTFPADYLSLWAGFVDQVIGTAALLLCLLALGDSAQGSIPAGVKPVLVGAVVLVIGVSMGSNCGYALNPARDFGPRLFAFAAGWGAEVFTAGGGWWWVPLVAPCVGALLGTLVYELMVEVHHVKSSSEEMSESRGLEMDRSEPGKPD
uniref:Uncharacterized protein n=1 Tax=Knipowitschia caucasica TaxID=637954 RepID=A0AAV2K740_KNICA